MSSGAEPEDLDPGCGGKTNAGSPEKKVFCCYNFPNLYWENIQIWVRGFQYPNLLVYISVSTEGHRSLDNWIHASLFKSLAMPYPVTSKCKQKIRPLEKPAHG